MEVVADLDFQDKQTINVKVENDIYVIRVSYSLAGHQLLMDVQEKKTFQFYNRVLTDATIPEELSIYGNIETIYNYLSQSPQKIMSYNTLGKYILFFDYISNKLKYNKIYLKRRVLSLEEKKDITIAKLTQQKEDLIEQVDRLRNQLEKVKERQGRINADYRQSQKQAQVLLLRIRKQQGQIELLKRENQELKKKNGFSHRSQDQEQILLNNIRKLRKGQNQQLIVRKLYSDGQIQKQQKSEEQKCNSLVIPQANSCTLGIFESNSPDIVYYGTKMKVFIDDQPNKKDFKIVKNTIEKISASETSSLLFFSSEEKVYLQQKKQHRVFIQIKNISLPCIMNSVDFRLIFGIIPHSATSVLTSQHAQSAMYLNTGNSSICLSGADIKTNLITSLKRYDIIRLVIDYEIHLVAWFLNDNLLGQAVIDSALIRQGFHPFIELKTKNAAIQIV